jgi:hypothetical protein
MKQSQSPDIYYLSLVREMDQNLESTAAVDGFNICRIRGRICTSKLLSLFEVNRAEVVAKVTGHDVSFVFVLSI